MPACREAEVPLRGPEGEDVGMLVLRVPPRREVGGRHPPLLDRSDEPDGEEELPPVQLLESEEYLYRLELSGASTPTGGMKIHPREMYDPDTDGGERGRLRPGLHTGLLPVAVEVDGGEIGRGRLEVRSRKLGYRDHYRYMLNELADGMAELVMQRFAPTRQEFRLEGAREAATLYQRFAFLRALIESQVFDGAIQHILRRPYRTWTQEEEMRPPGRGVPAGSAVARQLVGPGPRTDAGRLEATLGMETVPRTLRVDRTEETRDNVPNRFVRFALERWRDVVTQIHDLLEAATSSEPVERGLRESRALLNRLDAVLARELFRSCGRLQSFPASNQVLHKREGYRDVFRAYIQFEAAAALSWEGGEDVYGAGQRDVATLYEYWVFYAMGREISELCDEPFEFADLVEPSDGGLTVRLKRGERQVLSGTVRRLGRELDVELWFNRTFSSIRHPMESWTRGMRPDCSVRIHAPEEDAGFFHDEVWLHFDAKYRVDRLEDALGKKADDRREEERVVEEEEREEAQGRARRADLLKMHAYRDAIRRTSGAYVIYPGTEPAMHQEYHEILPGLGAFPLRPTASGRPEGAASLRRFVDEVLNQVALQTSQHERARYWVDQSYEAGEEPGATARAAPFLREPPADTPVLLGYVRSEAQHRWIGHTGLYNLRADGRTGSVDVDSDELGVRFVVLYGRGPELPEVWEIEGDARLLDREDMLQMGYSGPGGELYFCLPLGSRCRYPPLEEVHSEAIVRLHRERGGHLRGEPMVLNWRELVEELLGRGPSRHG